MLSFVRAPIRYNAYRPHNHRGSTAANVCASVCDGLGYLVHQVYAVCTTCVCVCVRVHSLGEWMLAVGWCTPVWGISRPTRACAHISPFTGKRNGGGATNGQTTKPLAQLTDTRVRRRARAFGTLAIPYKTGCYPKDSVSTNPIVDTGPAVPKPAPQPRLLFICIRCRIVPCRVRVHFERQTASQPLCVCVCV